jgi:hypothetical protein
MQQETTLLLLAKLCIYMLVDKVPAIQIKKLQLQVGLMVVELDITGTQLDEPQVVVGHLT